MPHWQTYLTVDDAEADAIRELASEHLPPERFAVVTELLDDGSEGVAQLALDVEAGSLGAAITAASAEWTMLRMRGGLPSVAPHLDFIVGPIDALALHHQVLLARARGLLDAGQPNYALVAAQTAFEVYVRSVFDDLVRHAMPTAVAVAIRPRGTTLRDPAGARLFKGLVGQRPEDAGDIWNEYTAHVRLRNGVVHEGAEVDDDTAVTSLRVVQRLIDWIDTAVSQHG